MPPTLNISHFNPLSAVLSIRTCFTNMWSQCVSIWHTIEHTAIDLFNLPSRLVHYVIAVFHAAVDWITMVLLTIAKVVLICIGTCIALLVLVCVFNLAHYLWKQSKRPTNMDRDRDREIFWSNHQYRFEAATQSWRWYGSAHSFDTRSSTSGGRQNGSSHASHFQNSFFGAAPHYYEERRTQGHRSQPRTTQADLNRVAREEQVRKQEEERKAAQAAQERLRNEEQERRRADTRRKLLQDESERIYQRWKTSCDSAFKEPRLAVPQPPSWDVHTRGCKSVQGLRACTCNIARLLSAGSCSGEQFSERQRKEKIRWHPDKLHFTRRGDGGPRWVEELYKAIQNAEPWTSW